MEIVVSQDRATALQPGQQGKALSQKERERERKKNVSSQDFRAQNPKFSLTVLPGFVLLQVLMENLPQTLSQVLGVAGNPWGPLA